MKTRREKKTRVWTEVERRRRNGKGMRSETDKGGRCREMKIKMK